MPNQYSPNQPGGGNSGAKSVKSDANMQLLKGSGAWVGGTEGLSYFWNAKEQAYFYQTDDKLTRSKSNFYRVTEGSAVYNNLAKKYPRGKNEYGVDYNPILDKYTTIMNVIYSHKHKELQLHKQNYNLQCLIQKCTISIMHTHTCMKR